MRNLYEFELARVGGGCSPTPCECPEPTPEPTPKQKKGNNGFGNGADDNIAAPGGSAKTGGGKDLSVGDDRGPR